MTQSPSSKSATEQPRRYAPAVVTEGGRLVWLAGHAGLHDDTGASLAGEFEAQWRQTVRNLECTLVAVGAGLSDLVTITVYLTDSANWKLASDLRAELLGPAAASAGLLVSGLAHPDMLVEIQGVASIKD